MSDLSPFKPAGWPTVTPRIIVRGAKDLIGFVKQVFGASGEYHPHAPAELRIGDSIIMISETGVRYTMPACLYVYVENADAPGGAYRRRRALDRAPWIRPMGTVAEWSGSVRQHLADATRKS